MSWLRRFIRSLRGPSEADYASLYPKLPEDLEPRPRVRTEIDGPPLGALIHDGVLYSPDGAIVDLSLPEGYRETSGVVRDFDGDVVLLLVECQRCGALLADIPRHEGWHAR